MKKYLRVQVDTNDADYLESFEEVSEESLDRILPVLEQIRNFVGYKNGGRTHTHNFPTGDCLREDMGEKDIYSIYGHVEDGFCPRCNRDYCNLTHFRENFVPYGEYGTHTLETVEVIEVASIERLV